MNETNKSPLIRRKPAWHVRFYRFFGLCMFVTVLLLIGMLALILWFSSKEFVMISYSIALIFWVFGIQVWTARWLRGYGVSFWKMKDCLQTIDGVPCPSCLYPLCSLDDADAEWVCPECGCGINGVDAIKAWDGLKGYRSPEVWNRWLKD